MNQSDFELIGNDYVFESDELRVTIYRDEYPPNPFEEWDCNWPMLAAMLHHGRYMQCGNYDGVEPFDVKKTWDWIYDNLSSVADRLDCDVSDCEDNDEIIDELERFYNLLCFPDKFAFAEWAFNESGIPAINVVRNGYCQRASTELLIVATPEKQKEFGVSKVESLEIQADLYASWAYGDVFGFSVECKTTCDHCGNTEFEVSDSCCGFYGSDFEKSGILEAINDALDVSGVSS